MNQGLMIMCVALFSITGCKKHYDRKNLLNETVDDQALQNQMKRFEDNQKQTETVTERMEETVEGMNQFALQLFEKLPDENSFFAPYSISHAISMLDNAADNDTKKELEKMLGIKDLETHNQNMKLLMDGFHDEGAILNTANSIWWSDEMTNFKDTMTADFLDPLRYYYEADIYQVDFAKTQTVDEMNEWIKGKTNEMIPKMLDELDPSTVMCLINAVYFEGIWENKFTKEATSQKDFYGTKDTVEVDMMQSSDWKLHYFETDQLRGIELPYENSTIAMELILPAEGSNETISEIFHALSTQEQMQFLKDLSESEEKTITYLGVPKFSMDYDIKELVNILKDLGMVDSFDTADADFGRINESLVVSDVMHSAKIEVDEEGSEAAAATLISMNECAMVEDQKIIEFIVNQPFIYVIRDTSTGTILFLGYINQL